MVEKTKFSCVCSNRWACTLCARAEVCLYFWMCCVCVCVCVFPLCSESLHEWLRAPSAVGTNAAALLQLPPRQELTSQLCAIREMYVSVKGAATNYPQLPFGSFQKEIIADDRRWVCGALTVTFSAFLAEYPFQINVFQRLNKKGAAAKRKERRGNSVCENTHGPIWLSVGYFRCLHFYGVEHHEY